MPNFTHERLEVYSMAIQFVQLVAEITGRLPRGNSHLADQLRRAATSIPLNIAEGAGEFSGPDKARFYRFARRSGLECAAILDVFRAVDLIESDRLRDGRVLLDRITAMLTQLAMVWERPDADGDGDGDGE